jgi:hypothetical protein
LALFATAWSIIGYSLFDDCTLITKMGFTWNPGVLGVEIGVSIKLIAVKLDSIKYMRKASTAKIRVRSCLIAIHRLI